MSQLGRYQIGDAPVIIARLRDREGGTATSTAIRFTVKRPDDYSVIYETGDAEVVSAGSNIWELRLPRVDRAGKWEVHAESTAGLQASENGTFVVERSPALV